MSTKWTERFMAMAQLVASWSKYTTKVGVVAVQGKSVIGEGFNGIPSGVVDAPERYTRPAVYDWASHAEMNLISHAARQVLEGSTIYVTHTCCSLCAAMIINAGVKKVVMSNGTTSMPPEKFTVALQMFHEAGVEVEMVP